MEDLDQSNLKEFANAKFGKAEVVEDILERLGNIIPRGINITYKHFLFFLQCFQVFCFSFSFNFSFGLGGKSINIYQIESINFADDKIDVL